MISSNDPVIVVSVVDEKINRMLQASADEYMQRQAIIAERSWRVRQEIKRITRDWLGNYPDCKF